MTAHGSVSRLIDGLVVGDPAAVQLLWERYFFRLVGLAQKRLKGASCHAADGEDVALSAFQSFCHCAEEGRFPELLDRDGLWRLLVKITLRKAAHLVRDEARLKRGGGAVALPVLEEVLSREPSPEDAVAAMEEYERLLGLLGEAELKQVALWRMEGQSVEQIAAALKYAPRSIKRKLRLIREIWEKDIDT